MRFTKVTDQGLQHMRLMTSTNPTALGLYLFLSEHMDNTNAVAATYDVLAEALGKSSRTIKRAVKDLEEAGVIVIAKMGSANVYILNPDEVLRTVDQHRSYIKARANVLVGKKDNAGLKTRLTHLQGQGDLFNVGGKA